MDKLRQSIARLLMLWATLKGWQKLSIILTASGVIILLILIILLGSAPSYEPLFSGLDVSDQGAIVAYLKENKINYRIESGANAIFIPKDHIYETRLALAQAGLPKGGSIGYEIFDNSKMGMSEFQQKIAYVRALEGELSRTIKLIDAVDHAKVNIVLPEQRLFLEQQTPSSATVVLKLRSSFQMRPEQVKAVVHLVSGSVQGLLPDNVTVIDTLGNMLSDMIDNDLLYYGGSDGRAVSSVQRELERQQEKELESKARIMLERVYGPGKVVVRVKVDLDFDKRTSMLKEFIPGDTGRGVLRSQQTMEETYQGIGGAPGGAPGTTTNIPGYAISTQNTNSEYNRTEGTNNFEITTRERNEVLTPGGIRRLTASVLIDGELEEQRINQVKELVSTAIGLNETRGDNLVVQSMRFSTTLADSLAEQMRQDRFVSIVIVSLIGFILLLLASALLAIWWKKRKAILALSRSTQEARHIPTIQEMLTSPDMIAAQGEISVLEEQLKAYARSNPKEVANLINEWLSED